jgi:hypothetical protein
MTYIGVRMNKNVGNIDRMSRIVAGLALGILVFTGTLTGVLAIILGVVAVALVLTSLVSFCPLYAAFKFSTRKKEGAK